MATDRPARIDITSEARCLDDFITMLAGASPLTVTALASVMRQRLRGVKDALEELAEVARADTPEARTGPSSREPSSSEVKCGVLLMLMALRRYRVLGEGPGEECELARLPRDVLELVGHWVVFNHLGLMGCAHYDYCDTLRYVSESGVRLKFGPCEEEAALSGCRSVEMARLLVEEYLADVDGDFHGGVQWYPLAEAIAAGHQEVVEYLLGRGAEIIDPNTLVCTAAKSGHDTIVRTLIERSEDRMRADAMEYAFALALAGGHARCAEYLVERVNPNALTPHGYPIEAACESGDAGLVKWLMERGAEVSGRLAGPNERECTPLLEPCRKGALAIVRLLVEHGAPVTDMDLTSAAKGGHLKTLQYVLQHGPALGRAGGHYNYAAALKEAVTAGHHKAARVIIAHFTDLLTDTRPTAARPDLQAVVSLMLDCIEAASRHGRLKALKIVLNWAVTYLPQMVERGGERAMRYAAANGHTSIVKCLNESGVSLRTIVSRTSRVMRSSCDKGNLPMVRFLLGHGATDVRDEGLIAAAKSGHDEIVRVLAGQCRDANNMKEALRLCCREGHLGVARLLMEWLQLQTSAPAVSRAILSEAVTHTLVSRDETILLFVISNADEAVVLSSMREELPRIMKQQCAEGLRVVVDTCLQKWSDGDARKAIYLARRHEWAEAEQMLMERIVVTGFS